MIMVNLDFVAMVAMMECPLQMLMSYLKLIKLKLLLL
jgi:hypothetical protein